MAKKTPLLTGLPHLRGDPKTNAPSDSPLFIKRVHELDREFARQSKQLTSLTKRMRSKVGDRLSARKKKLD